MFSDLQYNRDGLYLLRLLTLYCIHGLQVNPQFYAFRWITLLLTQEFSFFDCLHIWDALLSDPEGPLVRFALSIITCFISNVCLKDDRTQLSCMVAGKLTGDMLCDAGTGEEEVDRRRFHIEYEVTSTLSNYQHQPSLVCS